MRWADGLIGLEAATRDRFHGRPLLLWPPTQNGQKGVPRCFHRSLIRQCLMLYIQENTMRRIVVLPLIVLLSCTHTGEQKQPTTLPSDQAAQLLIDARKQNQRIELPDSLKPQTLAEGYRIQDYVIQSIGTPQKGWKVAITSEALMLKVGVSEPVSGPLFAQWIHAAPQTIADGRPTLYGFEFEFAFKMARDLPPREQPYSRDEIEAAVESMHLAIEPVGTRYTQGPVKSGVPQFAADHAGNYSLVHGPAVPDWQAIDLAQVVVTGYFDGQEIGRELGANVMGNPLNALTWLANHLPRRGHSLKAGEWVITGAALGPVPAEPPVKVRGVFGELGSIQLNFEG